MKKKRKGEAKPVTHWAGKKISDKKVEVLFLDNFVMHDGTECITGKTKFLAENYIDGLLSAEMIELVNPIQKAVSHPVAETRKVVTATRKK